MRRGKNVHISHDAAKMSEETGNTLFYYLYILNNLELYLKISMRQFFILMSLKGI